MAAGLRLHAWLVAACTTGRNKRLFLVCCLRGRWHTIKSHAIHFMLTLIYFRISHTWLPLHFCRFRRACRRLYWSMHSRPLTQKSRNSRALRDQLRWARMHVPEPNCSYRTRVLVDCRATLELLGSNRHKVKIVRLGQADVQSFGVNCRPPRERRDDARR